MRNLVLALTFFFIANGFDTDCNLWPAITMVERKLEKRCVARSDLYLSRTLGQLHIYGSTWMKIPSLATRERILHNNAAPLRNLRLTGKLQSGTFETLNIYSRMLFLRYPPNCMGSRLKSRCLMKKVLNDVTNEQTKKLFFVFLFSNLIKKRWNS